MLDVNEGFVIIGAEPELSPLEKLEALADKIDEYRQSLETWRQLEQVIVDQKIYRMTDDNEYIEAQITRQTRKCYFVRLPCGTSHCLSAHYIDELGQCNRRKGSTVFSYRQGWRIRQDVLSWTEQVTRRYANLKRHVVPRTVRTVKDLEGFVPRDIVQRLMSHYN